MGEELNVEVVEDDVLSRRVPIVEVELPTEIHVRAKRSCPLSLPESTLPHMYFCGQFNLDDWDSEALYVVLDDFNIKFFRSGSPSSEVRRVSFLPTSTVKNVPSNGEDHVSGCATQDLNQILAELFPELTSCGLELTL